MKFQSALFRALAVLMVFGLIAAGCSSDDDEAGGSTGPENSAPENSAPDNSAPENSADGGSDDEFADVCALALELFEQDMPPTADQLEKYNELAPDETDGDVLFAADKLIPAADDMVAFIAVFAEDDVEEAVGRIEAWESDNCGIEHDEDDGAPGVSQEIDDSAARVDVVATDYSFTFGDIAAGPTSFVMTNEGDEAHFLAIVKLKEGVTLDEAIASEDESSIEGFFETGLAAPGGEDEEVVTFDLEAGNYGMVCFIPDASGTPHAFLGMAVPFEVA